MKIVVFDVPAESGGALSVLSYYYKTCSEDILNNYIFVVSKPKLENMNNIQVLRFPWIKKSWFHRLFFDYFIAPKIVKKYGADEILSLQNVIIPRTKVKQTVYIHNALPFVKHKFSIVEHKLMWIYQNVISRKIFQSVKKANKVIVQTNWMKQSCIDELKVDENKVEVALPKMNFSVNKYFHQSPEEKKIFFYPASGVVFKNHTLIVDACTILSDMKIDNYEFVFTLNGDESKYVSELYHSIKSKKLPIKFVGNLSKDNVFDYYSKSILVFPSYIETVGLPLIEAREHKTPILASDLPFSREVLKGYNNVLFFPYNSPEELSDYLIKKINNVL